MCVRCGAMKNDSVREEMEQSLSPISEPLKPRPVEVVDRRGATVAPVVEPPIAVRRSVTADLGSKKTSPTLAEFVTRNAALPDWRLQLQNSVRQRSGRPSAEPPVDAVAAQNSSGRSHTSGANALKIRYSEEKAESVAPEVNEKDRKVANALKRIEESRRTFLPTEKAREGIRVAKEASKRFPYTVVGRSDELPELGAKSTPQQPAQIVRPKLISSLRIEKKEYDTNKLVPIPEAERMATSFAGDDQPEPRPVSGPLKENWSQKLEILGEDGPDPEAADLEAAVPNIALSDTEEIEDLAPISMRFNAGLFDLIIGGFASFVLLSPFLALSDGWFSLSGSLLFLTTLLVVMFVYLTAAITFFGQTFGMKLFSLELVDVEESEFPSLHQAAVSSSIYLLSLLLAGIGFIPMLLNEERRAAHDLVSGTILVRDI